VLSRLWLLGLAAGFVLCGVAAAVPSLEGPTGIVAVPTTDVVEPSKADLAISFQDMEGDDQRWVVRGLLGAGRNSEIGALYWKADDTGDVKTWGLNYKLRLAREPEKEFGLAVGAGYSNWDITGGPLGDFPDFKWAQAYVVGSKVLSPATGRDQVGQITGILGLVWDRVKVSGEGSETDANFMAGLEFKSRDGSVLGVELRPAFEGIDKDIVSAVLRREISRRLTGEIGWTNSFGPLGLDDRRWFAGVSWRFGAEGEGYYH